jgi:UDP-glucose 4-epimerase
MRSLWSPAAACRNPAAMADFSNARRSPPIIVARMNKNILITGATGKVGSRLAKRLVQQGLAVRALVRDAARASDLSEHGIILVTGDLMQPASLPAAVQGVDAVVHCAAFFRGATPEQAHAVNNLGTQHLAQAAREAGVGRFVFTSTGLVYGPKGGALSHEDDDCAPIDAYPQSKLAAEQMLLAIDGLDVRILRLPFVYGDGDPHIADVVPFMRTFPPAQRMSLGHHADVAQAVIRLLAAAAPTHRIYNVVDDEAPDLATLFASVGEAAPDGSDPERAKAFSAEMDGRRIREDIGFLPLYPRLADAVKAGEA